MDKEKEENLNIVQTKPKSVPLNMGGPPNGWGIVSCAKNTENKIKTKKG